VGVSCFISFLPHLIFGPGEDALALTLEYGASYENAISSNSSWEKAGKSCEKYQ
jgi:hypothetical protein